MSARLVVLASGEGTTLQALLDAELGVVAVVTDRPGTGAAARAERSGVPVETVALTDYAERRHWDGALAEAIGAHRPDLVCCAGFMRIIGAPVLQRFRLTNTHPALLPSFPGAHPVRDTLAAGFTVTGATVHWVDAGVDTGPVIAQVTVPVEPGDTEGTLHARIKAAEAPLYVATIRRLLEKP